MEKEHLKKTVELRHELHRHPELSMHEKETSWIIKDFLQQNTGFRIVDHEKWFYAVKKGTRNAGKIAFRADMDALPITFQKRYCMPGISHGRKQTIPMKKLWRASEDFGWYLKECPGAIVYIGNGENYAALHTEEFDFNDRILETAVDLLFEVAAHGVHGSCSGKERLKH